MTSERSPRVLIIAVWFGRLPSWISLWLTSCAFNSQLNWVLITDSEVDGLRLPGNVDVVRMSMAELAAQIESLAGLRVTLERPYKVCDLRPLFGYLTDLIPGKWDFWGHCDLDMIFGDVAAFLTTSLLSSYDRIFGVGHLSIYRNDMASNKAYRSYVGNPGHREILMDPVTRGFDEHNGVNRIWRQPQRRFYENESLILDIDPHIRSFRRLSSNVDIKNYRHQVFGFDRGRVIRLRYSQHRLYLDEFMYIHFQKRSFNLEMPGMDCDRFWITPEGFIPMGHPLGAKKELDALNPPPLIPTISEAKYRLWRSVRRASRQLSLARL